MYKKKRNELYALVKLAGLQESDDHLNRLRGCGFEFRCTESLPEKRNTILSGSTKGAELSDNPLTIRVNVDIERINGCALECFEYDSDSEKWKAITDVVGLPILGELEIF